MYEHNRGLAFGIVNGSWFLVGKEGMHKKMESTVVLRA